MEKYNYMIYRLYSWRLEAKDSTPVTTTELLMLVPHGSHLYTIFCIIKYYFPSVHLFNTAVAIISALVLQILFHWLFYNKDRWLAFISEFKDESCYEKRKGTIYIILYHLISHLLLILTCVLLL